MPDVADRVGRLSTAYPWLEPGVHLSLAQGGVEPDAPVARFVAQGSVYAQRYRGMGAYQVGETVSAGQVGGPWGDGPKPWIGGLQKAASPSAAGRALAFATSGEGPTSASSTGALAERGALEETGSAIGGALPGETFTMSPEEIRATNTEVEQQGIRPVIRAGTVVLDAPYQYLQAGYRTAFRNDVPLWSASRLPTNSAMIEQTTVGQVAADFAEGAPVELGTGYFANPDSATEQRRRDVMLRYGNVGGQVITPGRQAAAQIFEPGTGPYRTLSGLVDMSVALVADPVNVIGGLSSGSRGVRAVGALDDVGDVARGAAAADDVADAARAADAVDDVADVAEGATAAQRAASRLQDVYSPIARRRAAGGIDGTRRFVDPHAATAWLNGPEGTAVVDELAGMGSTYDIWSATGRQLDPMVARRLRDAATPDEVRSVLDEELGVSVATALTVRPVSRSRWAYDTPGESVDLDDIEDAVVQFERTARNAKVDDEAIREGVEALVEAEGREGRLTAFRELFGRVEDDLTEQFGLHPRDARMITRMWDEQGRVSSGYAADRLGRNAWSPAMLLDPDADPALRTASPLLDSEMVSGPVPLPDFRALRRATSDLTFTVPFGDTRVNVSRLLLEQGGLSRSGLIGEGRQAAALESAADGARRFFGNDPHNYRLLWDGLFGFTSFVFKPAALLRPAWTFRVALMDEQARLAASGLDGLYSHPLSALAWITGRRGATAPSATPWDEVPEYVAAMYDDVGPFLDEINAGGRRLTDAVVAGRGDQQYARGIADRIATLHASVVGRNTARAGDLDSAARWFDGDATVPWAGRVDADGNPVLLTESGPDLRRNVLSRAGGDWASLADDNPEAARRYLQVVEDQIRLYTGGDDELLDAVRTGEFRGVPVLGDNGLNDGFVRAVARRLDDDGVPDAMPDLVRVSQPRHATSNRAADAYNAAVRTAFAWLGSKPSNRLNRSPAFRQLWSGEMTRLLPWMDADAQARWLSYAEGEGALGNQFVREIRGTMRAGVGDVDFDTADAVARSYALGGVEDLLYSASKKGQVADVMRLLFPFGEAWKEMITTWSRLLVRRPQNVRNLEHGLESARDGFFDENEWGEQVFTYPLSGALTELVTGVGAGPGTPMPLTGRAQGLSMATEVLPGLGPVAQVPAGWFIPDQPKYDWLAEQVTPYGRTTDVRQLLVPRWLQRAATGATNYPGDAAWNQAADFLAGWMVSPEQQRTYNSTVMDVVTYLSSTGEYEQTPAGINDMLNDAKRQAASLYIMRGLSQSFSPSAPSPDFQVLVEGEGGEAHAEAASAAAVYSRFQELREEAGGDWGAAVGAFMEEFGPDAFMVMQSSSRATTVGAPVTSEGIQWVADNGGVTDRLPLTYGLFAPTDGEFDYRAYVAQFTSGEREQLTPEQFVSMGNNLVGGWLYRTARDQALADAQAAGRSGIAENQRLWLKDYRERLMRQYPGYDPEGVPGVASSASNAQLVRELERAVDDPAIAGTEAGRGLAEYFRFRQQAMDQAQAYTGDPDAFAGRQEFASTRVWLRTRANELIRQYPAFAQVWDRVLDNELDEDLEEAA